jgi:hypothetical protein
VLGLNHKVKLRFQEAQLKVFLKFLGAIKLILAGIISLEFISKN